MTIVVSDENTDKTISLGGDQEMELVSVDPRDPDIKHPYDIHVICDQSGKSVQPVELRFIRKSWPDFMKAWEERTLHDHLLHVDGLIVEFDPLAILQDDVVQREGESEMEYKSRLGARVRKQNVAMNQLALLSKQLWVITSAGPYETINICRFLEKQDEIESRLLRINLDHLTGRAGNHALLDSFPGYLNPYRKLSDGRVVGDVIWDSIDKEKLIEALRVKEWHLMDIDVEHHKAQAIVDYIRGGPPDVGQD